METGRRERIELACLLAFLVAALSGCSPSRAADDETYTLYRNSTMDTSMRVHIATFDARDGESYNQENCRLAQELFQRQDDVATKFWCEKGDYRE